MPPNIWDVRFLKLAQHIASWSKDPSTKVGCVIVGPDREIVSTGYNGFPRGVSDDSSRYDDRNTKLHLICHAEENAVAHAARIGVSLRNTTAYVTWPPCPRCARSLVQAGVTKVVHQETELPERWVEQMNWSFQLLDEADVEVVSIPVGDE
jgi:dCMP deaminase